MQKSVVEKIVADWNTVVLKEAFEEVSFSVPREIIIAFLKYLHEDIALDFDHITDLTAVDFPNEEARFEVVYQLYSIEKNHRIRVKVRVPEDDCTIDSATGIWKGANFLEREVYDMYGVVFSHHPDLRRILMTEDYNEGYPLRKDFPVEGRGWRDSFEFLSEQKQEG